NRLFVYFPQISVFYVVKSEGLLLNYAHCVCLKRKMVMAVAQQVFLRDAMRRLNLTREIFAARIGVKRRALDTWLLPEGSQEFRTMPEVVQRFVTEIVENQHLMEKYAQVVQTGPL